MKYLDQEMMRLLEQQLFKWLLLKEVWITCAILIDHVADGRLVVPTCDNDADGVHAAADQETTTGKVLRKLTEKGVQCQISL